MFLVLASALSTHGRCTGQLFPEKCYLIFKLSLCFDTSV